MAEHTFQDWRSRAAALTFRHQAFIDGRFVDGRFVDAASGEKLAARALEVQAGDRRHVRSGFCRDLSPHSLDQYTAPKTTRIECRI